MVLSVRLQLHINLENNVVLKKRNNWTSKFRASVKIDCILISFTMIINPSSLFSTNPPDKAVNIRRKVKIWRPRCTENIQISVLLLASCKAIVIL